MKRLVFLLVGSLFVTWATKAQPLSLGGRIGIATGSYQFDSIGIDGATLEPAGDRVGGYQAAIFLRLSIPTFIYIQPELQFSQRDYVFGIKSPSQPKEYKTLKCYRIELPILMGFKFGNVRLFGGPVWRLGSKQYSKGGGPTPLQVNFNDNDIAAMGGVGVEFDGVCLDLRYVGYLEQTTSEVRVAQQHKRVDVKHDGIVQINFGLFF